MGADAVNLQATPGSAPASAAGLLAAMTLPEKIGQMRQVDASLQGLREEIRAGRAGAVLNEVDVERVNALQREAVEESRLGIPLLVGRDVIHGFKTILPIPLGQAATWDRDLAQRGARYAALEAARCGVNWTFAPMLDISRDPRWGRIAESLGEDPYLCGELGAAMVRGFQGEDLAEPGAIAACVKHFAGYGAAEAGIDYSTANLSESELRNVYLPPFEQALRAGAVSVMPCFSDVNGVPGAANRFLLRQVLRQEWRFTGIVVSDWNAVRELTVHGVAADGRDAARQAMLAGVDMEMYSQHYQQYLEDLLNAGELDMHAIDAAVLRILTLKIRLGLFDNPYTRPERLPPPLNPDHRQTARDAAMRSAVLLKNAGALPLDASRLQSLAVIGPLADDGYEQLGTWVFDGEERHSQTLLQGLSAALGAGVRLHFARGCNNTRSRNEDGFAAALKAVEASDAAVLCLGEEQILSGEAHCRADIALPGNQAALVHALKSAGKPLILVIMAGRPLVLTEVLDAADALLYAWHPGSMGGPALADLLLGHESPSGKLPVTLPRAVGQTPIYYARKNTGRPPKSAHIAPLEDIDSRAGQNSLGMTAFHMDAGFEPLFPFGFGLSYTRFEYSGLELSTAQLARGERLQARVLLHNAGQCAGEEVAQLYLRDPVADIARPVRELKGFQRVRLDPGEQRELRFTLCADDLAYHNQTMQRVADPGRFQIWVGGDSRASLQAEFCLV